MRNEAELKEWKKLYEVSIKIKELEPWKYFWDLDLITIMLPQIEEPYYCSIMGRGGECFCIGTYSGYDAINDFMEILHNQDMPDNQLIRYQQNLMCYFGNRNEITQKEYNLIKNLGLKFRGKNNWIYFRAFEKGYEPYMLEKEQVIQLTEVLTKLYSAMKDYFVNNMTIDFEKGNTLLHKYDDKLNKWISVEEPLLILERRYLIPELQDDLLVAKLKKQQSINLKIEMDIALISGVIRDKKFDNPILTRLCMISDCKTAAVLYQNSVTPEYDEVEVFLGALIDFIFQHGKPKTIYVRDSYMESILYDLCEKLKIGLKIKSNLKAIDYFVNEMSRYSLF